MPSVTPASDKPRHSVAPTFDVQTLGVFLAGSPVGTLAQTPDGPVAFEYHDEWLAHGFSISPLSLPLEKRLFVAAPRPLEGLFGVFDDSLPDGWGRLLVDRMLREHGIDPFVVTPLTRLAIVGSSGMGALEYEPELTLMPQAAERTLDELADECAEMLRTDFSDDLDTLYALGGSSGGARPKIFTDIDEEPWIVKFPSSHDPADIATQEFAIAQAASACGIAMPEVRLLPSSKRDGFFAIKRFDRSKGRADGVPSRVHMASAGALLETSHRIPNLDYGILMKLTMRLTTDLEEIARLYRLMTFNVIIGNRDDHAKNFTYLCDGGAWRLSPGYDLTYNSGINGEHSTTVNGKGRDIVLEDLLAVAVGAGISRTAALAITREISDAANDLLAGVIPLERLA